MCSACRSLIRKVCRMDQEFSLIRSWMFVPGDRQKMIDKSFGLSIDAILMDIEDGVAPAAKDTARKQIAASLVFLVVRQPPRSTLCPYAGFFCSVDGESG